MQTVHLSIQSTKTMNIFEHLDEPLAATEVEIRMLEMPSLKSCNVKSRSCWSCTLEVGSWKAKLPGPSLNYCKAALKWAGCVIKNVERFMSTPEQILIMTKLVKKPSCKSRLHRLESLSSSLWALSSVKPITVDKSSVNPSRFHRTRMLTCPGHRAGQAEDIRTWEALQTSHPRPAEAQAKVQKFKFPPHSGIVLSQLQDCWHESVAGIKQHKLSETSDADFPHQNITMCGRFGVA